MLSLSPLLSLSLPYSIALSLSSSSSLPLSLSLFLVCALSLWVHDGPGDLPFTCWGEYGSELESGGDSGSVLQQHSGFGYILYIFSGCT